MTSPYNLEEAVRKLFEHNRVSEIRRWQGVAQATYHAPSLISPPKGLWQKIALPWQVSYPHQWFWDSVAHAIVLRHIDIELAKEELRSLLYTQRGDGFIPHLIWNHSRMHWLDSVLHHLYPTHYFSPYLQPPILASGLNAILEKEGDAAFLGETLPRLSKYYVYLEQNRCRSDDGLLEIITPYESGKDKSPEYDSVLGEANTKPTWRNPLIKLLLRHWLKQWDLERILASQSFRVKDLLFNCIYADNMKIISQLHTDEYTRRHFLNKAQRSEASILEKMYDPSSGLFFSLDARHNRDSQIKVATVSTFLPLLLDTISQPMVDRLLEHLTNPQEFWAPYPVPAEPLTAPPAGDHIWRGQQTWLYTNWLIVCGLLKQAQRFQRQDYKQVAQEITSRSLELVEKQGFREFYHSVTGQGRRAQHFGWSTLVLDMVYNVEKA